MFSCRNYYLLGTKPVVQNIQTECVKRISGRLVFLPSIVVLGFSYIILEYINP